MVAGYVFGIVLWILLLNQIFGYEEGEPSKNMDGLIYLPALFATPLFALFFIPPFSWAGGIWSTGQIKPKLDEPSFKIWLHSQPVFNLILSVISLFGYLIVCLMAVYWQSITQG